MRTSLNVNKLLEPWTDKTKRLQELLHHAYRNPANGFSSPGRVERA